MKNLKNLEQNWIKKFNKPFIIAGPCSAESEEQLIDTIKRINKSYITVFRSGIWKPRTKPGSFEGIGEIGLKWLQKIKNIYNIPIAIEIANAKHAKLALKYDVDYLWIGARSTVNPFTVQEIAESISGTDKIVLVKNPVNPDLELWIGALERLNNQNIKNIGIIHRGFSSYKKKKYRNNPKWKIVLELKNQYPNIPVITDPSHICGNRKSLFNISQQALNYGFQGLMIETHCNPDTAWSDSEQQVTPEELDKILKNLTIEDYNKYSNNIYNTDLKILRDQINKIDQQIITLIYNRLKLTKSVGNLKQKYNIPVFQSNRWNEILKSIKKESSNLGLQEKFIEKLFQLIHIESINIQNNIIRKQNNNNN